MSESETLSGLGLLRMPFPENQISKLPKPHKRDSEKGKCLRKKDGGAAPDWQDHFCGGYHGLPAVHLDYVGHAALTDRLLDADLNWTWEPLSWGEDGLPQLDASGGMWIKLTVCGVTRIGYGSADGKSGGDAVKERIGDALRNAAMRFGAALELWHKGDLHVEEKEEPSTTEKMAAANIKPAAGALETLSIERQREVNGWASTIVDHFTSEDANKAFAAYNTAKERLDADEQVALRGLLPSNHKTTLRKMAEAAQKQSLREMAGSQA